MQALSGKGGLLYMEKQIHGGNIFDKDILLDYSVNINPLGMPEGVREVITQNID